MVAVAVITAVVVTVVVLLIGSATDHSSSHDRTELMSEVTMDAKSVYGAGNVSSITCPQQPPTTVGANFTCTAEVVGEAAQTIKVHVTDGGWTVSMRPLPPHITYPSMTLPSN
ncbi:DUF4333 domain-containing protein [Gordonia oryzae]|uniref:DUF4333 domain-containing protein n=1 Tax=Gordonia oryzae TaxID=2487349 RepID=A0A3N4GC16_9ACTN|nr:DUF4333 domain-containing protein [Gordonia oryzae]